MKVKVFSHKATGTVAFVEASKEFLGVLRDVSNMDLSVLALILQPPFESEETERENSQAVTPFKRFLNDTESFWSDENDTPEPLTHSQGISLLLKNLHPGPHLGKLLTSLLGLAPTHLEECQGFKVCRKLELLSPLIPSSAITCPVCKHWENKETFCTMGPASFIPSFWCQKSLDVQSPIYRCVGCLTVFSNNRNVKCPRCGEEKLHLSATILDKDGETQIPVGNSPPGNFDETSFFYAEGPCAIFAEDESSPLDSDTDQNLGLPTTIHRSKSMFVCNNCNEFISTLRNVPCTKCNLPRAKTRRLCTIAQWGSDDCIKFHPLVAEPLDEEGSEVTENLKEERFIMSDGLDVGTGVACTLELCKVAGISSLDDITSNWVSIGWKELLSIAQQASKHGCSHIFSSTFKLMVCPQNPRPIPSSVGDEEEGKKRHKVGPEEKKSKSPFSPAIFQQFLGKRKQREGG